VGLLTKGFWIVDRKERYASLTLMERKKPQAQIVGKLLRGLKVWAKVLKKEYPEIERGGRKWTSFSRNGGRRWRDESVNKGPIHKEESTP